MIELLGTQGLRALTHGRVDARAGLPRGSTSNHFRTRQALLGACDPQVAATAVMAYAEGVILHRIARHDETDPRPSFALVVAAALR